MELTTKKKKTRTTFSFHQLNQLEQAFQRSPYPDVYTRKDLATKLSLSDTRVQVWFQNRRAKWRRKATQCEQQHDNNSHNKQSNDKLMDKNLLDAMIDGTDKRQQLPRESNKTYFSKKSNSNTSRSQQSSQIIVTPSTSQQHSRDLDINFIGDPVIDQADIYDHRYQNGYNSQVNKVNNYRDTITGNLTLDDERHNEEDQSQMMLQNIHISQYNQGSSTTPDHQNCLAGNHNYFYRDPSGTLNSPSTCFIGNCANMNDMMNYVSVDNTNTGLGLSQTINSSVEKNYGHFYE